MRLLVTGGGGQVATLIRDLPGCSVDTLERQRLDITNLDSIAQAVDALAPDVIVNAAAYTAVDRAEAEEERAFVVNRDGARNVAVIADRAGLPIVHLSTDYVFAGDIGEPYREGDATGPRTAYGRSKLAGELEVAVAARRHIIMRTAWVFSPVGSNFVKTILRLAAEREEIGVVADQRGNPTHAGEIARGIGAIIQRLSSGVDFEWGVYHFVCSGDASWFELATEVVRVSGQLGGPVARIVPVASDAYKTAAKRPLNSRLDTTRFIDAYGYVPAPWQGWLRECVADVVSRGLNP